MSTTHVHWSTRLCQQQLQHAFAAFVFGGQGFGYSGLKDVYMVILHDSCEGTPSNLKLDSAAWEEENASLAG